MNNQEFVTDEMLASIGITIAAHAKTGQGWGWSIQNDKIVRDWEGPYPTPAGAAVAALAWLLEYAHKGLLCHHIHTAPVDDEPLMPWERAFTEGIPQVEE